MPYFAVKRFTQSNPAKLELRSNYLTGLNFLSLALIVCQLFLVSSFLFIPNALAEDTTPPPAEEAPTETPPATTEPVGLETPLAEPPVVPEPITDPAVLPSVNETTTTPEDIFTPPSDATTTDPTTATTTDPVIDNTTTTIEVLPNGTNSDAQVLILGTGNTGSTAPQVSLTMENAAALPRILASWAMHITKNETNQFVGTDDNLDAGAQFLPSGQYQVNKSIAVCAISADGASPVANVFARLFYPTDVAVSSATSTATTSPALGCGAAFEKELRLEPLSHTDGLELVCNQLKNNNNNLPGFNTAVDYDALCGDTGLLNTYQAQVFCQAQDLTQNDPSGLYQTKVYAADTTGAFSLFFDNTFKYLELTAFAVDFDAINYGPVQLNIAKIVYGNLDWETPLGANPATLTNVGNTRLRLVVKQNDFGLGGSANNWNVNYQARLGLAAPFITYQPETAITLNEIVDLGTTHALDFGIQVFKFPSETSAAYAGQMTLLAEKVDHLACPTNP